ncbi:MAG: Squalene epoxidase [Claussenomyces sp. TS43310]|nr:MAG: Squalene epoxidase [Claussenomyces sp. TS43310]
MTTPSAQAVLKERRRLQHDADVVVVGAGVFGCAIASAMAKQGRSVLLLERWMREPDRIIGELLQPGGYSALEKLGLADCAEEIDAVPTTGYSIIYHGDKIDLAYPKDAGAAARGGFNGSANEKSERPEGRSFHHGRFIRRLRESCAREPNITIVETTATSTITADHSKQVLGVTALTTDPATGEKKQDFYFGKLTIIADGYASIFRKQYINKTPVVKSKFYALELIDCPLPSPTRGHVILSDAAPVLLYQIGTHETRALIDVPPNLPAASVAAGGVKGYIKDVILPSLPAQVRPSFAKALEEGKLQSMPNSWLPPTTQQVPGMILVGDAMNMRHPLTGGGMTVVFNDVVLLSELLSPEKVPELSDVHSVQSAMRQFHWQRKKLSSTVNILAQALYALFAADDRQLKALQNGCFQYFHRGGKCVDTPMGLLGGIIRQPFMLFYHFFAVAVLSIWLVIKQTLGGLSGAWKLPLALGESVMVLYKACVVLFPFVFSELRT